VQDIPVKCYNLIKPVLSSKLILSERLFAFIHSYMFLCLALLSFSPPFHLEIEITCTVHMVISCRLLVNCFLLLKHETACGMGWFGDGGGWRWWLGGVEECRNPEESPHSLV
jgi:hypothetical protein